MPHLQNRKHLLVTLDCLYVADLMYFSFVTFYKVYNRLLSYYLFFINNAIYPVSWIWGRRRFYKFVNIDSVYTFTNLNNFFFNKFQFTQFFFQPYTGVLSKYAVVEDLVYLNKKCSFLKRREDVRRDILGKYQVDKFKLEKTQVNEIFQENSYFKKLHSYQCTETSAHYYELQGRSALPVYDRDLASKMINFKSKFNLIFFENRKIFRYFFGRKVRRQFRFDKRFNSLFKKNFKHFLLNREFLLLNILLRSRLIFTRKNFDFLMGFGCIALNGIPALSHKQRVHVDDVVQLSISTALFFKYRVWANEMLSLDKKVSARLWRLTRFAFNVYKEQAHHVPRWADLLFYSGRDVPRFLEVDYTANVVVILYKPECLNDFTWGSFEFINLFLIRLYSWKYIT